MGSHADTESYRIGRLTVHSVEQKSHTEETED